jgi:hypothetical protein
MQSCGPAVLGSGFSTQDCKMCCIFVKSSDMDLQTRKLNAIEYIAGLEDEDIFNMIELTILENKVRKERILKPLTKNQLLKRVEKSNKEYQAGKFKTQEVLEKESESW